MLRRPPRSTRTDTLSLHDALPIYARNQAAQVIPAEAFARREAHDRAVAEARAAVNAGATTIELTGDATGITIGGEPLKPNRPRTFTGEAQIALGGGEIGSASCRYRVCQHG